MNSNLAQSQGGGNQEPPKSAGSEVERDISLFATQPIVVLVEPQLSENIGMCARAMLNCGLSTLRLVAPRGDWPSEAAKATAADADVVLAKTEVFESLDEAIHDCHRVFATTARERRLNTPVVSVRDAAKRIRGSQRDEHVAVLFGPEASGLDNDCAAKADTLLRIPTNPDFSSLNLAQAVLLFAWEWWTCSEEPPEPQEVSTAVSGDLQVFLGRLSGALEDRGFFLTPELKPHSERLLEALFSRTRPSTKELQFLHGALTALQKEENAEI
ncbi:MAG: RNA methyltransferase [Verrucomicrobiota bacterium]